MEYRSVSTKLPANELTLFKSYCERKGVTPASLIRHLILNELNFRVPHTIAGRNIIKYKKEEDSFSWGIKLDTEDDLDILRNISPSYLENLNNTISQKLEERNVFVNKKKRDSIPVPSGIFRRGKNEYSK